MIKNFLIAIKYFCQEMHAAWRQKWWNAKALLLGRITIAEIEDDTIGRCESCSAVHPYEEMASDDDGCYFCPACVAEWNKEKVEMLRHV